jgi:hypothetical protein
MLVTVKSEKLATPASHPPAITGLIFIKSANSQLFCGLFYDADYLDYIALNGRTIMNDKLEDIWKKVIMAQSRCYSGNGLEELRKTMTNLSQGSWRPG